MLSTPNVPRCTSNVPRCTNANYHVFTLGAARCSVCGWSRYAEEPTGEGAEPSDPQTPTNEELDWRIGDLRSRCRAHNLDEDGDSAPARRLSYWLGVRRYRIEYARGKQIAAEHGHPDECWPNGAHPERVAEEKAAEEAAARASAADHACTVCGVPAHAPCITYAGDVRSTPHVARRRLAGEDVPSAPATQAQTAARQHNWFLRCVRGAISALSAPWVRMTPAERADLDVALAALRRIVDPPGATHADLR